MARVLGDIATTTQPTAQSTGGRVLGSIPQSTTAVPSVQGIPLTKDPTQGVPYPKQEEGMFSEFYTNLMDSYKKRTEKFANIKSNQLSGKVSFVGSAAGYGGNIVGAIGDVGASAIGAVVPDTIEDMLTAVLAPIGQSKTMQDLGKHYADFKQAHPEAATFLEAGIDIASVVPVGKALREGQKAVTGLAKLPGQLVDTSMAIEKGYTPLLTKDGKILTDIVKGPNAEAGALVHLADNSVVRVSNMVKSLGDKIGNGAAFLPSMVTTIDIPTIKDTFNMWREVAPNGQNKLKRINLEEGLSKSIGAYAKDLSDSSSVYDVVRGTPGIVDMPDNYLQSLLSKSGLKVSTISRKPRTDASGPVILGTRGENLLEPSSAATKTRKKVEVTKDTKVAGITPADTKRLENLINDFSGPLTYDQFLNLRSELSSLSRFDAKSDKSSGLMRVAKNMRNNLNETYRDSIPGLKDLDKEFEPKRQLLDDIRGAFERDGKVGESASRKLLSMDENGALMKQVSQIYPDIARDIHVLKAIDKWEKALAKPGAVSSARVGAGALGFMFGGPLAGAVGFMMATPQFALPVLRAAGITKSGITAFMQFLGSTTSAFGHAMDDVSIKNTVNLGKKMVGKAQDYNQSAQVGMSLKSTIPPAGSIAERILPEQVATLRKAVENMQHVKGTDMPQLSPYEREAVTMLQRMDVDTSTFTKESLHKYLIDIVDQAEQQGVYTPIPVISG